MSDEKGTSTDRDLASELGLPFVGSRRELRVLSVVAWLWSAILIPNAITGWMNVHYEPHTAGITSALFFSILTALFAAAGLLMGRLRRRFAPNHEPTMDHFVAAVATLRQVLMVYVVIMSAPILLLILLALS